MLIYASSALAFFWCNIKGVIQLIFLIWCRETVYAQLGTMQMSAVFNSQLTPVICWLLARPIIRPIAMIFAIFQLLGAYWLAMGKL